METNIRIQTNDIFNNDVEIWFTIKIVQCW